MPVLKLRHGLPIIQYSNVNQFGAEMPQKSAHSDRLVWLWGPFAALVILTLLLTLPAFGEYLESVEDDLPWSSSPPVTSAPGEPLLPPPGQASVPDAGSE